MSEEEPPRKKVNCYIMNSVPRPICNVEFKCIPFYRSVYNIIQPVAIYCASTVKPVFEQQEHTQFEFDMKLPEPIVKLINEKSESTELLIRFGKELPGMSKLSEELPEPIQISVNSHTAIVNNSPMNYNCLAFLSLNGSKNKISILWPHCKTPYYMMLDIVESVTIEYLMKRVQFNNKLCSVTLNTKAKAMDILKIAQHSDIEFSDVPTLKLSLLCPITKLKMKLPTRSLKCSNLQCFDLHALFSLNKIRPTWKCPACNIPILVDELVVDTFILDIINSPSLPENCFQIILYKNGNWEPYIEPKKEFEDGESESDIENSENATLTVDLGNYNDDNLRDEKNILPKKNDGNC